MRVLGIDPGKHGCGWGYLVDGLLKQCGYGFLAPSLVCDLVLLEIPNVHDGRDTDKQDLITVALTGGKFVGSIPVGNFIYKEKYPVQWKGTAPKGVVTDRIKDALELNEIMLVNAYQCRAGLKHNILDGIGIALKEVGRL